MGPTPSMSRAPRSEVTGFVPITNIPEHTFLTASSPAMETPACDGVSPTRYCPCSQGKTRAAMMAVMDESHRLTTDTVIPQAHAHW